MIKPAHKPEPIVPNQPPGEAVAIDAVADPGLHSIGRSAGRGR